MLAESRVITRVSLAVTMSQPPSHTTTIIITITIIACHLPGSCPSNPDLRKRTVAKPPGWPLSGRKKEEGNRCHSLPTHTVRGAPSSPSLQHDNTGLAQ